MANVFVEARPKGRPDGSPIEGMSLKIMLMSITVL
jgi:hypothetical protein